MRPSEEYKTTTNRYVYNRQRKFYLEQKGEIHCTYCQYHSNENSYGRKYYHADFEPDSRGKMEHRYPNWKLVSKNRKQWMKKPMKFVHRGFRIWRDEVVDYGYEIKF